MQATPTKRHLLRVMVVGMAIVLSGCIATMKALRLATFNEVLIAVRENDPNKVRIAAREGVVFDDGEKAIDSSNICGERPLHLAIQKGNLEIVTILLQEGADPDLLTELPRETSLCDNPNLGMAPPGYPALHYAVWENEPAMAEAILFAGADPSLTIPDGKDAKAMVKEKEGFEVVDRYLDAPAHLAARTGDVGALQAALDAGADPAAMLEGSGRTPLDEALLAGEYYIVDLLLAANGAHSGIDAVEFGDAADEYLTQNPDSAYASQLRQLKAAY